MMPDFLNQPYIAEVLMTTSATARKAPNLLRQFVVEDWIEDRVTLDNGAEVFLYLGKTPSVVPYHRSTRVRRTDGGEDETIPRTTTIRRRQHFLYDLLMLRRDRHLILAVPFHGLAAGLFIRIDEVLAGTRTLYERLNITNMVIQLGSRGRIPLEDGSDNSSEIVVTRSHLAYSDPGERRRDIEQVRLTGANLGSSEIYTNLVGPVLDHTKSLLKVTPILLGFALLTNAVRKSSATTDRHGNFKVTVGPGLRQIVRLFSLLDEIERLSDVMSTTSNIPIRQSAAIEAEL